jgi:hypothetical protein
VPSRRRPPPPRRAETPTLGQRGQADAIEAEQRDRERDRQQRDREREREQAQAEREASRKERERQLYEDGQDALEDAKWQRAVERFSMAPPPRHRAPMPPLLEGVRARQAGQKAEALATAAEMMKVYPSSRWMSDAKALELQ